MVSGARSGGAIGKVMLILNSASTTRKSTCVEHVTDNPSEFKRAHWLIRSMKVWKR
jgi:hypothetical protein